MKKLLFLDFDGVINCTGSFILMNDLKQKDDDNLYCAAPNPVSVNLVQRLLNHSDVECVVSSSWRIGRTLEEVKNIMIESFGFTNVDSVIDMTPNSGKKRGYDIQEYLQNNPTKDYCIIDDDKDFLDNQLANFVKIDCDIGFTYKDYAKTLLFLNIVESKIIY